MPGLNRRVLGRWAGTEVSLLGTTGAARPCWERSRVTRTTLSPPVRMPTPKSSFSTCSDRLLPPVSHFRDGRGLRVDTTTSFPAGRGDACESTAMDGSGWKTHCQVLGKSLSILHRLFLPCWKLVCSVSLPGKPSLSVLRLLPKCAAGYLGDGCQR